MIKAVQKYDKNHQKNHIAFVYKNNQGSLKTKSKAKEIVELVNSLAKDKDAAKQSVSIYRLALNDHKNNLILLNLGKEKEINKSSLRENLAKLYRGLEAESIKHASFCVDSLKKFLKKEDDFAYILGESLDLAAYDYKNRIKKLSEQKEISFQVIFNKTLSKALYEGCSVADATNFARELGDSPANLMTPTIMAKKTQAKAKGSKVKVSVWDKARLEKERFACLLGVSRGSVEPPKVIIMEYKGGNKSQKPLTLVGKGLTFDTGGNSLKPSAGMEEMKYDMCGGANVIGAMFAIAALNLKVNVSAYIGCTENMPGGNATKPGDVHIARNGKTIEINNTDAEGRLVLADLLSYVSEKKPAAIVDAATLTGAMLIALGNSHTGFYTSDNKLAKKVEDAADNSKENVWRMPVCSDHQDDMKGTFADLSNLGSSKLAGSAQAAAFLKNFVPEEIPYAHFDIAGTAWNCQGRTKLFKKGATGSMVRTFTELARNWK